MRKACRNSTSQQGSNGEDHYKAILGKKLSLVNGDNDEATTSSALCRRRSNWRQGLRASADTTTTQRHDQLATDRSGHVESIDAMISGHCRRAGSELPMHCYCRFFSRLEYMIDVLKSSFAQTYTL